MNDKVLITRWAHDIVCGPRGLLEYRNREGAYYHGCEGLEHDDDDDIVRCEAAYWAVSCLMHPDGAAMLAAVVREAERQKQQRPKMEGA